MADRYRGFELNHSTPVMLEVVLLTLGGGQKERKKTLTHGLCFPFVTKFDFINFPCGIQLNIFSLVKGTLTINVISHLKNSAHKIDNKPDEIV